MKKAILTAIVLIPVFVYSQITTSKSAGGSVVLNLGFGIAVNGGSSLTRDWISLNDAACPVQLTNVGINADYTDRKYRFKPAGSISASEPITAYEIHHVLYDVFGDHIKTLSNSTVSDIAGSKDFDKYTEWYANENQISDYLVSVSYVALVRTKAGTIWRYNPLDIKAELNKIKIAYDVGYAPPKKVE